MIEKIKPTQYMFLITGFISGSILLIPFLEAKHDSWLATIAGFIVFIPFILCYMSISKKFPGKNLIEIHDIVYGKVLGKIVSVLYIFFFLSLFAFNIRDVAVFYTGFVMAETPMSFFLITMTLLCAYAVGKGIPAIARVSFILVILLFLVVVVLFILLIGNMDFSNFLPVLEAPADSMYRSTQTVSMVHYGEIIVLLMFIPYVKENRKLTKFTILGVGLSALVLLNLIVRNIATLGSSSMIFVHPSFQSVRFINIGDFLNRIETLAALNNTTMMFLKISIIYYATVKGLAQILNLRTYKPLIIPVGILAIVYAILAHSSEVHNHYWGVHYSSFFEIPFVVVFPFLSLIIIKIRGLHGKVEKNDSEDAAE